MSEQDDLVQEFLIESYENLDQLDRDFVELEKDPTCRERLASVFRTIHTIKGTCGFFGFSRLESLTHTGENLLSLLRDGKLDLTPAITSALLRMVDTVREILSQIEASGQEPGGDDSELISLLKSLQEPPPAPAEPEPVAAAPLPPQEPKPLGEILIEKGIAQPRQVLDALREQASGDPRPVGEILVEKGEVCPREVMKALRTQQEAQTAVAESNIRVDVGLLDKLMNLVGELVLARNQVLQFAHLQTDAAFLGTSQRLNLITTELQEGVMKTRMQPIGNVWNKFPRVVRDLSLTCGKKVRIEMEGQETELDKTLIEAIKDPLTHIIRNSVDHGIESPEVRAERGKSPEGCLSLRAFHEGGQVNIEIADDGGGINVERVKNKALERGLISQDRVARMNERELLQLIFLPGFSTAEKITNVSGRGVGMDVVKTNIEKIGGTVDLHSELGQGTTVKIKIPLTLAIIPALIVTSGGDRYAIPQVSLLELVRLEGDEARKGIERIHGALVYRLRGNLLPIVYLNRELKLDQATERETVNIVVLQADDRQFGLVVEGINDTEEIVVKPLSKQLKNIPLFAGATIMGDGRVALILDVLGIAQRANVVSELRDRNLSDRITSSGEGQEVCQTLLLFRLGEGRRLAVPLSLVARLEEIPSEHVETADGQEVIQYRGQIMPLIRLYDVLGCVGEPPSVGETLQVVVYSEQGQSIGLVVGSILDIVETPLKLQKNSRRPGLHGSAIVQQHVTDIVDLTAVVRMALPDLFSAETPV